jgi:hypothetical protein
LISPIFVPFFTTRQCRIGRSSIPTIRGSVGREAEAAEDGEANAAEDGEANAAEDAETEPNASAEDSPCPFALDVSLGPAAAEPNGDEAGEPDDNAESSASTVSSTGPWIVFWRGMTRNGAGEV